MSNLRSQFHDNSAVECDPRGEGPGHRRPHEPAAFYQTRAGLFVYRDFRDRIVRKAKPTQSAPPVTLHRFILERDAPDENLKIEAELGPNHIFTETEVCWIVAEMIGKQKHGAPGDLDNTINSNLFYTPSWVVDVRWGTRGWSANALHRDDIATIAGFDWYTGFSAFSRN